MPSTPKGKRHQMTYEDLIDRFYYDEISGRFRFARTLPPRGKRGELAGAWNEDKQTWQISWQGAPFSMAVALWLWQFKEWPPCEVMVSGDVTDGLWPKNLILRSELKLDLDTLSVETLRRYMHYDPVSGVAQWLISASPRGKLFVDWHSREERKHRRINFMGKGWPKTYLIWWYMTGELPGAGLYIDHKDGNPFNNQWGNLRLATPGQNSGNSMSLGRKSTQHLRGVQQGATGFYALASQLGVKHRRGPFPSQEEAHEAYKKLHAELHGTFSVYASRSKPDTQSHPYETT